MKPIEGTSPNRIGLALLSILPEVPAIRFRMKLPVSVVISASGKRMWFWSKWRVIAGPTHCIVERTFA
jgi:hypothetical protein